MPAIIKIRDLMARHFALCSLLITLAIALLNYLSFIYDLHLVSEWSGVILMGPMLVFNPIMVFVIYHALAFLFFLCCLSLLNTKLRSAGVILAILFLLYVLPTFDIIFP